MITLAKRLKNLQPSPTLALNAAAQELKRAGVDIINFTLGEPDFDTPMWIQESVTKAMHDGITRYTSVDGLPELKNVIQKKFKRDYDIEYPLNMITIGAGTKQIIFNAMLATLNKGDEVIIPAPYWVSYPEIVKFCEGNPIIADGNPKNHYKIDADELRFRINSHTKWVILNSPNNPSGAVYTKQELFDIAQILVKNPHVYILCDDIYEYLTYDVSPFQSIVKIEPRLYYRTLVCNGISKSYAMTGFRLGYAAGPQDVIQAINLLHSQSTSSVCSLSQAAAIRALNEPPSFFDEWKNIFDDRRQFVHKAINDIVGLSCELPQGAFYMYVNCEKLIHMKTPEDMTLSNDEDVCTYLLKEANVAVVPGKVFGLSPYFRISYATSMDTLKEGCKRIQQAVSKLKSKLH